MEVLTPVKEKPILFSTAMVLAILEGRKTQTRRVIKNPINERHIDRLLADWPLSGLKELVDGVVSFEIQTDVDDSTVCKTKCPYGNVGDRLWVRETWAYLDLGPEDGGYVYRASENGRAWESTDDSFRWKPSIHMPRKACRLELEITDVRVERLHDISDADAIAEGIKPWKGEEGQFCNYLGHGYISLPPKSSFESLWHSINGKERWDANPWVWVVSFKPVQP